MKSWPLVPGVPAAGHVTASGFWHPGRADGCAKCPTPPNTASRLPRADRSWEARHGRCAVWLSADTVCSLPPGHLPQAPHRGYDPSGSGRWIEYDDTGREVRRSDGPW